MTIDFSKLTGFTQALVRAESPPGQEQQVVALVEAEMRRLHFDNVWIDANGSVIGVIAGGSPGPTLLMDAHCDTVGVAPGAPWQHDPFGAEVVGDRMYGRGTSDMKGAAAAMVHAAAAADRSRLAGRVAVSVSVMEEVMEGLALRDVMAEVQPDFVVIGESTDLNLAIGGRGRAEIHLEALGKPSHSSAPHLGINAVHRMIPAIQAIDRLTFGSDPLLGPAILALTDIISEPYPGHSVIPSRCRVTYDRRLLPGETEAGVLAELTALPELEGVSVSIGHGVYQTYTGVSLEGDKFFPAWKLDPEQPFVQAALAGLHAAGLNPALRGYRFCTNAAYSAGVAGIPTLGFGPSPEGRAHVIDEYIKLADLHAAANGYLGIIESALAAEAASES